MVTRREALRFSGTALCGATGGCLLVQEESADRTTRSGEASATKSPAETDHSETSPVSDRLDERLELSAEVLEQSSRDSPARIAAELGNTDSETVLFGTGPTLLFSDKRDPGSYDWAEDVVVDPEAYIGPWDDPYQTDDGCWRFPEDGSELVQSSIVWHDLESGESVSETYEVYTRGESIPCLPGGTYRYQDAVTDRRESRDYRYTLILQIDSDGKLTTSTEGPTS